MSFASPPEHPMRFSDVDSGNGLQGFQTPIQNESFVVDGMGVMGNMHSERGLTYYEVALSGHM